MSKVLRVVGTALALAGSIAATAASFGATAPVLGLTLAQAGAIAATAGGVLAAVTAKKPSNERAGSQLSFKIDSGGPIPWVIGRTAVGGTVLYRDTYGTDNSYQTYVVALSFSASSLGIAAIEAFTVDKVTEPFSGTRATGYYSNWMWQDRRLGAAPSTALGNGIPVPPPWGTAGAMPGWSAASKLSGFAASSWSMLYDTKARRYGNGEPQPAWIVLGDRFYDPRLDSTYPGGSGPCRWADPSDTVAFAAARATWVYSERPALAGLMWRLGLWARDETDADATYQKVMGIGAKIDQIDLAAIVHAANVQEANGWKIGGQFDSGQDRWEVLKLIEETGGCEPIANGALMSTLIKAPRVSIGTIVEDDMADGAASAPGVRLRSERLNGFRARFRSEPHGWELVPIDIVQIPDYVTADGRAKTGSHDYSYCQDATQCAQLAAYEIFDSRELDPITIPLKPKWMAARLGDCVTLNFPSLGLDGVDAIVRGRQIDPATGIVTLTLRTETAAKHAPALGQTGVVPPTPTLSSPPDTVPAPGAGAWALAATMVDGDALATPALEITGAVDNSQADAVVFEWRKDSVADWSGAGIEPPDTQGKEVRGVDPDTVYWASVRYRARGILSDRLVLGPVTTPAKTIPPGASPTTLIAGANVVIGPGTVEKVSGGGSWNAGAWSAQGYAGDVIAVAQVTDTGAQAMIGLNSDPATDDGYWSIDYAVYNNGSEGRFEAWESNAWQGNFGTLNVGDFVYVRRRGNKIEYGVLGEASPRYIKPDPVDPAVTLYFDCSIVNEGYKWINCSIQPVGSDGEKGEQGDNGIDALNVSALPNPITVACSANGTPKDAVPGFQISATQGASDVTGAASYSFTSTGLSGVSDSGGGTFTVAGMSADTGSVTVTVSNAGSSATITVTYTKLKDGAAFVNDSATIGAPGTSYGVVSSISLLMGPDGTIEYDLNGSFSHSGGGSTNVDGYVEYTLNGGSTWTSGDSFTGNAAVGAGDGDFSLTSGLDGATIGLATRQTVTLRVQMKKNGGPEFSSFAGGFAVQWTG